MKLVCNLLAQNFMCNSFKLFSFYLGDFALDCLTAKSSRKLDNIIGGRPTPPRRQQQPRAAACGPWRRG